MSLIDRRTRSSRSRRARVTVIFGMAAFAFMAAARPASGIGVANTASLAAADFLAQVMAGQSIELEGVTIVGDLDLRGVNEAPRVIRCTDCIFQGSLRSSNVIFERLVDLSGSTVAGRLDFDGAVFRDTFLMRRTPLRRAAVVGPTSFSLASFRSVASFEGIQLCGDADFRVAHFLGDTDFGDAMFGAEARFDSAVFGGRAEFSGAPAGGPSGGGGDTAACGTDLLGGFGGPVRFPSVNFGQKADFRQRAFSGPTTFAGATFGAVDFTLAVFHGPVTFDGASVEGVASFRIVTFDSELSFQQVVLGGPTDFEASILLGPAEFFGTSATDSLSLARITVAGSLRLEKLRAKDLSIDLDLLDKIDGELVRQDVLAMLEASARAKGDLGLANEAAFRRSEMATARSEGLAHYQGVAGALIGGHLVKPFYPLQAFVLLLIVGSGVRAIADLMARIRARRARWQLAPAVAGQASVANEPTDPTTSSSSDPKRSVAQPAREGLLTTSKVIVVVTSAFSQTLRAAFRLKPQDVPDDRREELRAYLVAFIAGLEWLAYKVLLALFLIGLANSNPTFKELVEAVI